MDIRCAYREKIISKHATVKQPALTKQTVPISIVTTLIQRYVDTTASVPVDRTVPVITLVLEAGIVHMEEAQFVLPITEILFSRHLQCLGNNSPKCSSGFCACQANPVDGSWTEWGSWSPCSKSCGQGIRDRTRSCSQPAPSNGGQYCVGSAANQEKCTLVQCPIDGQWTYWGSWSSCSGTCGTGYQTRVRSCTNPAPAHGGSVCSGLLSDYRHCSASVKCPVDGGWSDWMIWSPCSVTCGEGVKTRARTCGNPAPSNGGKSCVGDIYDTQSCNNSICGGLVCPSCDASLNCVFNSTCDSSETCMIRAHQKSQFTVHCSKVVHPGYSCFCKNTYMKHYF
ncbi:properdin-like [Crassostrea virginica]